MKKKNKKKQMNELEINKFDRKDKLKNKNLLKKIALILAIVVLNTFNFVNAIYASNINTAHIYSIGDCGELLIYKGIVVKSNYVVYTKDGVQYPAYCMDKTKTRSGFKWI